MMSEKEITKEEKVAEKVKKRKRRAGPPIPRLSLKSLGTVMKGYLAVGFGKDIPYQEAAKKARLAPASLSTNNRFLEACGFLERVGKGIYRVTEKGVAFAYAIDKGKENYLKAVLLHAMTKARARDTFESALSALEKGKVVPLEDCVLRIADALNIKERKPPYLTGIRALVSIMEAAGLVKKVGKKQVMLEKDLKDAEKELEKLPSLEDIIKEAMEEMVPREELEAPPVQAVVMKGPILCIPMGPELYKYYNKLLEKAKEKGVDWTDLLMEILKKELA